MSTDQRLSPHTELESIQHQAQQAFLQGDYRQAARLYEQAIELEPDARSNYWNLGLTYLAQGKEDEAQTTWLLVMAEAEPDQQAEWVDELIQLLELEALRREQSDDASMAWAIRQHIREIAPGYINNLLHSIQLAIKRQTFSNQDLVETGICQALHSGEPADVEPNLLNATMFQVLEYAPLESSIPEFLEASVPYISTNETYVDAFIDHVLKSASRIAYYDRQPALSARLGEICLALAPKNLEVMRQLAPFYQNAEQYDRGIEIAYQCYSCSQTLVDQIYAIYLVLRGVMSSGGRWQEALENFHRLESLLQALVKSAPGPIERVATNRLISTSFFQPYFRDDLKQNRLLQNQVLQLCQANINAYASDRVEQYSQARAQRLRDEACGASATPSETKRLKIGYVSHCFKTHSVGWLARWLIKHHNHEQFETYAYFVGYSDRVFNPLKEWYQKNVDHAHLLPANSYTIADQISKDGIDILVDLDSLTLDTTCEIMALKPAPIAVTWLGWDASGIPAIDYFIADPYVLPEHAQEFYPEKIWRLPHTYIAIDGFELSTPTLRRDDLGIPPDAVVYLSSQRGYKRHIDTVRLQMKIIKAVPNSYFLIKGIADQDTIQTFFNQIAEEEGVEGDRLRFLPQFPSESVHRANIGIADIVLDTYPYNGATTTLETLWAGVPIVTLVGTTFSSRNTYTMMVNAGIEEGIAWTNEEYVEWGVRLGTEPLLRQHVHWKLVQSRHTAPLWNAKQFTKDMEEAYQQMWANWVHQHQA
jgi:predicted O-linked N-acetylglucosamine transferase (SPINDLY family)